MFTNITASYNNGDVLIEAACLSTDTKPTDGIANGSACIEMDTGDKFMFDEANQTWLNITNPSGGDAGEVWLVGENEGGSGSFPLRNNGTTDYMIMLYINAENYLVFINGEELPYFTQATSRTCIWADSDAEVTMTKFVSITKAEDADEYSAEAYYIDSSTAPTSVEVSVKAK